MSIEVIRESASGKTVLFGTQEGRVINSMGTLYGKGNDKGGRYLVEYAPRPKLVAGETFMVAQKQYFDDRYSALEFYNFQAAHEKYVEAKEAGLDDRTAEMIAEGKMSLAEALGDMNTDDECDYIEYAMMEDDGMMGGEDDNTPSLEVIMAGGQAAWEYQNEKNAWLDNRMY